MSEKTEAFIISKEESWGYLFLNNNLNDLKKKIEIFFNEETSELLKKTSVKIFELLCPPLMRTFLAPSFFKIFAAFIISFSLKLQMVETL